MQRLLLVSDIHCAFAQIARLGQKLQQERVVLDAVLCCGDLANVDHAADAARASFAGIVPQSNPLDCTTDKTEAENEYGRVLEELGAATAERGRDSGPPPVFFVPGNHDPAAAFSEVGRERGCVHQQSARLAGGRLAVVGLGGAVAARLANAPADAPAAFPGYPWDEPAYALRVAQLEERLLATRSDSLGCILVTHGGPAGVCTSADRRQPAIETGSASLAALLNRLDVAHRGLVPLMVHGHAHHSRGVATVGGTTIVNPGPLRDGRFALIDLIVGASSGGLVAEVEAQWRVARVVLDGVTCL